MTTETSSSASAAAWLARFRAETAPVIAEPFFRCLAEAIATVESAAGGRIIVGPGGINEIGYKSLPGHPIQYVRTREADPATGRLAEVTAGFRLFRDRTEQGRALLWLLRSSHFYDSARMLFILAFYSAYAPGRTDGARELIKVFNHLAGSGAHEGVRPLCLTADAPPGDPLLGHNHDAARAAVRLFAELTS